MLILELALNGDNRSITRQKLEGVDYKVEVFWLDEAVEVPRYEEDDPPPPLVIGESGVWALTLSQGDGTTLLAGQVLRSGVNVLAGYRQDVRFPGRGFGRLLAADLSGAGRDPGRNDLVSGSSVRLVYFTAAESA